jgi:hypothetical protein
MKLSEAIEKLQTILVEEGNLDVVVPDGDDFRAARWVKVDEHKNKQKVHIK